MDHTLTRALAAALFLLIPQAVPDDSHTLQAYEVGDLTNSVQGAAFSPEAIYTADFELAEERLAQLEDMETLRKQASSALAALEEVVRLNMEPPLRDDIDELRSLGDNLLVMRGSDEQHAWLHGFLETQRTTDSLVSMSTKVWTIPHGIGSQLLAVPDGETQRLLETRLDVDDVLATATALQLEAVTSPKLLAYPRQRANVSVLNQVSYVSEWKLVRVVPDDVLLADPVIDVIQEGITVDLRAVPLEAGFWSIDTEIRFANLERPIMTRTVQLGEQAQEVKISFPVVSKVDMASRFTVGSGGGALFLTHDQVEDRDIVVLIQVEEFDPSTLK